MVLHLSHITSFTPLMNMAGTTITTTTTIR